MPQFYASSLPGCTLLLLESLLFTSQATTRIRAVALLLRTQDRGVCDEPPDYVARAIPVGRFLDLFPPSGSLPNCRKPLKNRIGQQRNSKPRSLRARWRRTQSLWVSWTPA